MGQGAPSEASSSLLLLPYLQTRGGCASVPTRVSGPSLPRTHACSGSNLPAPQLKTITCDGAPKPSSPSLSPPQYPQHAPSAAEHHSDAAV